MSNLKGILEQAIRAIPNGLSDDQTRTWLINVFGNIGATVDAQSATGNGDIKADGSVPFTGQETFSAGLKTDTISPDGTSGVSFTSMIGLAKYTSAQEAALVPADGFAYYNTDLDVIRTYNGSAWSNTAPSANPTFTGVVKIADGSAAAPSLTFTTDPNTGIILSAADSLGFVTNGVEKWVINSSGSLNPVLDNTYDIGSGLVNPRDIQASRTLIAGKASTTNGALTFQNSAGATTVTVSSPAAKQILIDNTGHDVIVGINTTPQVGIDLTAPTLYCNTITVAVTLEITDTTTTITQPAADTMLLTASAGVSTSAGLTVGGGVKVTASSVKTANYSLTTNDFFISADGSSGAVDIEASTLVAGQICTVIATDISNSVRVTGITIGNYTFLTALDCVTVYNDGTNIRIISEYKQ